MCEADVVNLGEGEVEVDLSRSLSQEMKTR